MNALDFLQSVAGYNQSINGSKSYNKPNLLAVIDPAYSAASYPGTLPKVTFEGESTMSTKRYAVLGWYEPQPSDRVGLVPYGSTYAIIGAVNTPGNASVDLTDLPQGIVGFNQLTSDSSATSAGTVLDVLSATAFTPISSTRLIKITVQWRSITTTVSLDIYELYIREGSTLLNSQNHRMTAASVGHEGGTMVHYIDSPTAASHTYKLSIARVAGTGSGTIQGSSFHPIQIICEDMGPS